jgi:hypothetical protein
LDIKEWDRSEKTLNGYHIYLNAPEQYKREIECLNGYHATGFNEHEKQYVTSGGDKCLVNNEYILMLAMNTGSSTFAEAFL